MADIFLSYARSNASQAKRIAAALGKRGYSVWFDQELPAHRPYADVISSELDAATAVLVLWSAEAAGSQWVRSEANRARETGRLVQARLDDARLPMPFDQIQCADLRGWKGSAKSQGMKTVLASLGLLLGGQGRSKQSGEVPPFGTDRRRLMIGAGALATVAAAGLAGWRLTGRDPPSPEAQLMLQKGLDALQQNDALDAELSGNAGAQAVALLTNATEAAPDSAMAWGGLAMAYAVRERASTPADRAGYAERSRFAARRALALEKNELRALAALSMLNPVYRNWLAAERAGREALELQPSFPIHIFLLSDVLGSVGRWAEASQLSMTANRTRFLIPGADRKVIVNLWAAGDLQEADRALSQAIDRWPEHPQVWRTRLAYLLYGGRPTDALDLLDSRDLPAAIPDKLVAAARGTAQALIGSRNSASAVRLNLAYLEDNPVSAPQVAQACAAVGEEDTALTLLSGYYFGEGAWASLAPPGGDSERVTAPLFMPPMRGLWKDPRFNHLLDRIGLEAYWRRSGTLPDYRRTA